MRATSLPHGRRAFIDVLRGCGPVPRPATAPAPAGSTQRTDAAIVLSPARPVRGAVGSVERLGAGDPGGPCGAAGHRAPTRFHTLLRRQAAPLGPDSPTRRRAQCLRRWSSAAGDDAEVSLEDPVPSTYSVRLVNVELSAGLIDDGRHDHPDPHRPPPWCQDPALPRAREPRVAAPTGRPAAHRAASTAADRRPPALGPAVPPLERLDGCHLHRPTRHCDPMAAVRLQALLDPEEPPDRARPSGRRPGGPSAHPTDVPGQPPLGCAADSRGTPEVGPRDLAGDGVQVHGAPPEAPRRKPGARSSTITSRPSSPWTSSPCPR